MATGRLESVSTTVAERAWCVVVPHHARGARQARHRLADELDTLVTPDRLDDAIAIAAELIGNAVVHAAPLEGDVIRVAWRLIADGTLEIRVTDGGAILLDDGAPVDSLIEDGPSARTEGPHVRSADPESLDGRGLTIVAALATRWGVENDDLGQCVWATL